MAWKIGSVQELEALPVGTKPRKWAQSQGHHITDCLEERHKKRKGLVIFLERTRKGQSQSDQAFELFQRHHWINCLLRLRVQCGVHIIYHYIGFPKHVDIYILF